MPVLVRLSVFLVVGGLFVLYGGRLRLTFRRAALAERRLSLAQENTGTGVFELDFESDRAFGHHGPRTRGGQIIAVELNVQGARVHLVLFDARDQLAQSLGQRYAAALDADQRKIFASIALLDNFVSQTHQGALDLRGRHQSALGAQSGLILGFAHGSSLVITAVCSVSLAGSYEGQPLASK